MSNNTAAYASSIIKLIYHIYILTNWLARKYRNRIIRWSNNLLYLNWCVKDEPAPGAKAEGWELESCQITTRRPMTLLGRLSLICGCAQSESNPKHKKKCEWVIKIQKAESTKTHVRHAYASFFTRRMSEWLILLSHCCEDSAHTVN